MARTPKVHYTVSFRCERAVGRLAVEQAESISVAPCENHKVLRLRECCAFAPLRMTDLVERTFAEISFRMA